MSSNKTLYKYIIALCIGLVIISLLEGVILKSILGAIYIIGIVCCFYKMIRER